jgi:hypothetical protein
VKIINKTIGRYLFKNLNVKQKRLKENKILDGNIGYVNKENKKDVSK